MKRKLLALMMAFILVFAFSPASFAALPDGGEVAQPYATASVSYSIDRLSATKAEVYVHVFFTTVVDSYNVVIYLEKLVDGEWVIDMDNSEYVSYNNGWGKRMFTFYNTYEGLERGASYRIMCISKDVTNDSDTRLTSYSDPF